MEGEDEWLGAEAGTEVSVKVSEVPDGAGAGVMVPAGVVGGGTGLPDSPGTVVGSPGIVVGSPGMVVEKGKVVGSGIEVSVSVLEVGKVVGMLESPPGMEESGMVTTLGTATQLDTMTVDVTGGFSGQHADSRSHLAN